MKNENKTMTAPIQALSTPAVSDFDLWWSAIGSGQRPSKTQDVEEFAKCMCEWAWESARATYSQNAESGNSETNKGGL